MNRQQLSSILLLITGVLIASVAMIFSGCSDKVTVTQKYTIMEPVYLSPTDLRAQFEIMPPVEISNSGKIYLYKNYILLNEPGKGIHIIDNTTKKAPKEISFINIPGNYDMAVQNDHLFADSYIDLIVLDISDPTDVKLTKRIENIFLDLAEQDQYYDRDKGILVKWAPKEIIDVNNDQFHGDFPSYYYYDTGIALKGAFTSTDMLATNVAPEVTPSAQTGIGGSMARFTISQNHLYSIGSSNLQVFDIQHVSNPVPGANVNIGWGMETIFPYKNNLFIGSQSGMIILDNSNPELPVQLSIFSHIVSCDPVVVQNDIAYVTLRGGTSCRNDFTNQLDVVDISDLKNPKLIKTYPMTNPHGVGIDNGTLFVCEGNAGLKVFDATDVNKITDHLLAYYGDFDAYDVIPYQNTLILIGNKGLYQFDYSDPNNITQLSMLPINRPEPML